MAVNPSRIYAREFAERAAARGTGPDFRVLDAGAGSAPYADLFAHLRYETADVAATPGKDYSHITYQCDVIDVPVEKETFDLVWCSQVLEHVPEPERALHEFFRILKPGGEAWLTAPFYYQEHEKPWDFYRYTRFAWERFAKVVGFEVVEIEPMEGYYAMLAYTFQTAAKEIPLDRSGLRSRMRKMADRMIELEMEEKRTDIGMCKNYQVVFRKPA